MLFAKGRNISTFATCGWLCSRLNGFKLQPNAKDQKDQLELLNHRSMPKLVILAAEAPHSSLGPATKSQDSLQQQKGWSERNLSGSMRHHFFPDFSCRFDTKAFQEFPVSSTKSSNRLSVSSWKGSIPERGSMPGANAWGCTTCPAHLPTPSQYKLLSLAS